MYLFLCSADLSECLWARTFNYRFILLEISRKKCIYCVQSVSCELSCQITLLCFIFAYPTCKILLFLCKWIWICPFLHAQCSLSKKWWLWRWRWRRPRMDHAPKRFVYLSVFSQVDHCTCDVHKTDQAFPFREIKAPEAFLSPFNFYYFFLFCWNTSKREGEKVSFAIVSKLFRLVFCCCLLLKEKLRSATRRTQLKCDQFINSIRWILVILYDTGKICNVDRQKY